MGLAFTGIKYILLVLEKHTHTHTHTPSIMAAKIITAGCSSQLPGRTFAYKVLEYTEQGYDSSTAHIKATEYFVNQCIKHGAEQGLQITQFRMFYEERENEYCIEIKGNLPAKNDLFGYYYGPDQQNTATYERKALREAEARKAARAGSHV